MIRLAGRGGWRRAVAATSVLLTTVFLLAWPRPSAPPSSAALAHAAALRYLDQYMEADGRVVRRDQGGDTVSEGQAYALLLAVAVGDRVRFDNAWAWTRAHLQRADGLLAWRWASGQVADANPAGDADVDAAHALVLAARRFGQPSYLREGARIARAILTKETVGLADGMLVLVAGPWARSEPYIVNPSYIAPTAFTALAVVTEDRRWAALGRSSYQLVRRLTTDPPSLPPDWAQVDGSGQAWPIAAPGHRTGHSSYGFDAARLLVRLANDCTETGRELARTAGLLLPREEERVVAVYDLKATPAVGYEHPVGYVAAAAVAVASGDRPSGNRLLARAEAIDRQYPTYYGAAWVALGRAMLTTSLLNGCEARATP